MSNLPNRVDLSNTPSPNNATAKLAMGEVWDYVADHLGFGTTAGSGIAYTLTLAAPITAYEEGHAFNVKFHTASGVDPTLQVSGLATPPNLVKQMPDGSYANIGAGDITANHRSPVRLLSATQALVERLPLGYTPANDSLAAHLAGAETFTGAKRGTVVPLTDGATITPDFAAGNNFSVTLGGNRTLANPSNIGVGQSGVITITQDGTGSRTLAFGSYWKFTGGDTPSLTAAAGAVDVLAYYVESATRITAKLVEDSK